MYGWVSEYHFGCTDVLMATREVCRFVSHARFYFHAHKRAQKHTLLERARSVCRSPSLSLEGSN